MLLMLLTCIILQIVECNALPMLILMLRSEDASIHYEAVRFTIISRHSLNEQALIMQNCSIYCYLQIMISCEYFRLA